LVYSSYSFLFVFLPIVLTAAYVASAGPGRAAAVAVVNVASLVFFAHWHAAHLPILVASVIGNWAIGTAIVGAASPRRATRWMQLGLVLNLASLGYFKYFNFLVANVEAVTGQPLGFEQVVLPIGISFFTFTQIAFLVDVWRDRGPRYRFADYLLFATFFPHLIAGPIFHHKEMMPQFAGAGFARPSADRLTFAVLFFVLGLAKKVLIADPLAGYADPVFAAADAGVPVTAVEAWLATIAYALQLFFDFSGYADMAIGLGHALGVTLPQNFDRPYAARSIAEFWRRWHMTLSRFLRDYLYIPLGGSRHGFPRELAALMVTMVLGGLWHGASWNFVLWGALHGAFLVVHRLWRRLRRAAARRGSWWAWALTMLAVAVAWVPFRAVTLDGALALWSAMAGRGALLPLHAKTLLGPDLAGRLASVGVSIDGRLHVALRDWPMGLVLIAGAGLLAVALPASGHLVERLRVLLIAGDRAAVTGLGALSAALLFVVSLLAMSHNTVFLYFQF
jgi:D-alanyl-lipoteichoic acid acyltransferase DltB (MBOAT superfamily)